MAWQATDGRKIEGRKMEDLSFPALDFSANKSEGTYKAI
jgi:hypothetical protein